MARGCELPSAREELLKAARRLFAAKGFDGVTLKELAEETGHNAALVNYYFSSKAGLFRECVLPLFASRETAFTLRPATCAQDFVTRFQLFLEHVIITHLRQREVCAILQRDLHIDVVKELFREHVNPLSAELLRFLKAARASGIVRADLDAALVSKVILSSLFHLISLDRFREELGEASFLTEKKLSATMAQLAHLFLGGLIAPEQ